MCVCACAIVPVVQSAHEHGLEHSNKVQQTATDCNRLQHTYIPVVQSTHEQGPECPNKGEECQVAGKSRSTTALRHHGLRYAQCRTRPTLSLQ